jgi:hypothetical protein
MKFVVTREMELCNLLCGVAHDEDEVHRIGPRDVLLLDFV